MNLRFDYLNNNFTKSSSIITNWAVKNNLHLLDFDECMYYNGIEQDIIAHLIEVKKHFSAVVVVECHPYFETDNRYIKRAEIVNASLNDLNLRTYYLTADYTLWNNSESNNRTFFPDWYFRQRKWGIENFHHTYEFSQERKYNFSCGNKSNLRSEKIINYIECYRRRRPDWLLTMYNHAHSRISDKPSQEIEGLNQEQLALWDNEIRHIIPEFAYDIEKPEIMDNAHALMFPLYKQAFCNLVMEHSMEVPIISEKSYKPFVAHQVPIFLGYTGIATALKNLGFDLFYDFIDHNLYENININRPRAPENYIMRINKVHELIDNLYTGDFQDFFHDPQTKKRLQNNKEYFFSDEIDKLCIRHLDQLLNKY